MAVGWYRRLVLVAMLLTLFVVVLGAYVRLSDAGLGCPDWPGCYGKLTPVHAQDEIAAAMAEQPHGPVSMPKAWKEMVHRYFASTLGLLVLLIAVIAWMKRQSLRQSPWLPSGLVVVIVFQGLLGMWTVTLLLKPAIVTAHLIGGMTTLALLTWLLLRQLFPIPRPIAGLRSLRPLGWLALVVTCAQIVLGGWVSTNYAALACTDFPTCHQTWLPDMAFADAFHIFRELGMTPDGTLLSHDNLTAIHFTHRVGAVLTTLVAGWLAVRLINNPKLKPFGWLLLASLACQVLLGIANVLLHLPLALAVAHNAGAALLLISLVTVNYRLSAKEL
ncbi:COX15/CtaA family protein [Chitinivorax sp. B]|uniref:COX15/CtaA family protein n=1 Tax=Chitinivorax sp. B TaxID=2502235 RepID=UPI0010F4528B|nr:COX15/CtaA family protein [Chitinivorax sp. B]